MKTDAVELGQIIKGMREAYSRDENCMAWARNNLGKESNSIVSTLLAYDLQAGSYVANAKSNPDFLNSWCAQLAELLKPYVEVGDQILEVGVGEATTLVGVMKEIGCPDIQPFGFDISWSRIKIARKWASENGVGAQLFVGDLLNIPMEDNSVDVIYTAHSLEPNGGQEDAAIRELLRVARKAVVMIEPLYELASEEAKQRMAMHGYVRGLKSAAEQQGSKVVEYGLLDVFSNPLNPSGVVLIAKSESELKVDGGFREARWQCPLTATPLTAQDDIYYAGDVGIAYPVLREVPLLRAEHGIVASQLNLG